MIYMSNFYPVSKEKLLSLSRVTTTMKLSIISSFHVVYLSFRFNEMMVNTNRKKSSVQLLC